MKIIQTQSLTKHFGLTTAINAVSLEVHQGEIHGCLGLNGAGKTTLIRMLLALIKPDKGSIQLFGKALTTRFDLWNQIGYLVETPYSYPNLSVRENLSVYYKLRQLTNPTLIDSILDKLKLTSYQYTKAKFLSVGNQQRLGLAKALMHQPKLLILDEPINGLDPEGIVEIRELLKELALQGTTIFLSSHILGEISKVATKISIIHHGKLIKQLTREQLSAQLLKKVVVNTLDNVKAVEQLTNAGYSPILNEQNYIEMYTHQAIIHPERIARLLVDSGHDLTQLYLFREDLEHYFLHIIKTQ